MYVYIQYNIYIYINMYICPSITSYLYRLSGTGTSQDMSRCSTKRRHSGEQQVGICSRKPQLSSCGKGLETREKHVITNVLYMIPN